MTKKEKAERIGRVLDTLYPDPPIPLRHHDPFTLLVAVVLSAQCTDARVNQVTPRLFALAPTPEKMARLSEERIASVIRSCGLTPQKSKAIRALSHILVERYAARWSIEQAFTDARNVLGAGEARNRARRAVERTVPFALIVHTLVIIWYARHGHDPAGIAGRRAAEPWYTAKTEPAFEDMLTQLRRVLICARISGSSPAHPEPEQITAVLAAWHAAAA